MAVNKKASSEVLVEKYYLPPTSKIPNSRYPLLHYPGFLSSIPGPQDSSSSILAVHDSLKRNDWETQWIWQYGADQPSHYHSRVHECMVVLSGEANIRFGLEDNQEEAMQHSSDPVVGELQATRSMVDCGVEYDSSDYRKTDPGLILHARKGDVFIVPAGVAHKTQTAMKDSNFRLLSPGNGHGIADKNDKDTNLTEHEAAVRQILGQIQLSGFTMMGAYPAARGAEWDFALGGEDLGNFERVWNVELPEKDPVLGDNEAGLRGLWARSFAQCA